MAKSHSIAQAKYDSTHCKYYTLKMNLETDSDVIEKLSAVESKQGYIKQLIREDLARTRTQSGISSTQLKAQWIIKNCDGCFYCSNCDMPSMNTQRFCCGCGAKMS